MIEEKTRWSEWRDWLGLQFRKLILILGILLAVVIFIGSILIGAFGFHQESAGLKPIHFEAHGWIGALVGVPVGIGLVIVYAILVVFTIDMWEDVAG